MAQVLGGRVEILRGDITQLEVGAIVNAANRSLLGGGGVDGAIHRVAGPELLAECRRLGPIETGEVAVSAGYRLPAGHVLHAVGPVWSGGHQGEDELLASCYRTALTLAEELGVKSIAFPCISTGAYGFPFDRATRIALTTVASFLRGSDAISEVVFCCFSETDRQRYVEIAEELGLSG